MQWKYRLNSKLPHVGTTIFTVMNQLAGKYNAVNLGQGFPDYEMSPELVDLVSKAMRDGMNQYAHMAGYLPLRQKLAEKIFALYGAQINDETDITITPGGTYAIYTALTAILQKGDEVIVFEPAYDSYVPNIESNGATAVLIPLTYPGYAIPWHEVREKVNAKTKAIIINSPHNPTGSVLHEQDIEELKKVVDGTNIFIVSDEVYEHLVFDDLPHLSMLRYPELLARSFVCFSFGKTYNCTGWKLGYCISAPAAMVEFRKIHQYNSFSCFTPSQVALTEFLNEKDAYLQLGKQMQQKRDYLAMLMKQTPFTPLPSHGSYFQCYSYANISDLPDTEFATKLVEKRGVVTIPVSAFYQNRSNEKVVRFCFSKKEETLKNAVDRLISLDVGMVD